MKNELMLEILKKKQILRFVFIFAETSRIFALLYKKKLFFLCDA